MSGGKYEDMYKWIDNHKEEKINRMRMRHPMLSELKKYCNKVVLDTYKSNTGSKNITGISIFEADKEIKTIDKAEYYLNKYLTMAKNGLKTFRNTISNFSKDKIQPLTEKINFQYQEILSIQQKNKAKKQTESDEIIRKLKEKEKLNELINRKLVYRRIGNFFREALRVKKNYVIEIKKPEKHESLFYKIFKITAFNIKCRANIRPTKLFITILFSTLLYYRYSAYQPENLANLQAKEKLTAFIFSNPEKVKKIYTIYNEETDALYHKVYKKEFELMRKIPQNKKDLSSDSNELPSSSIDESEREVEHRYFLNSGYMILLVTFIFIVNSGYFIIKNRKKFTKKYFLYRSTILFLVLNEVTYYLSALVFNGCKIVPGEIYFKEGPKQYLGYNFYKENMINCYSMI